MCVVHKRDIFKNQLLSVINSRTNFNKNNIYIDFPRAISGKCSFTHQIEPPYENSIK